MKRQHNAQSVKIIGFSQLPEKAQEMFVERLTTQINIHIKNTSEMPSEKVRDKQFKMVVNAFNQKQYLKMGGKMACVDDALIEKYNAVAQDLYDMFLKNNEK